METLGSGSIRQGVPWSLSDKADEGNAPNALGIPLGPSSQLRATAEYLNALGLQMILAGPEADQPKMSSFLNIYYDMSRNGTDTILFNKNVVLDEARELLMSDNYLLYPEIIEQEVERIRAEVGDAG